MKEIVAIKQQLAGIRYRIGDTGIDDVSKLMDEVVALLEQVIALADIVNSIASPNVTHAGDTTRGDS